MLRTCIGCRNVVGATELVRLVLDQEGEPVVVLAGGAVGRGAWVHPHPACLAAAPSALARAFRASVRITGPTLTAAVRAAAVRRLKGLLASAKRAQRLEAGASAVRAAIEDRRARLVLVATDAQASAEYGWLLPLVASGSALAFATKALFAEWLSRPETALVAITDSGLAQEIRRMIDWTLLSEASAPSKKRSRQSISSEVG